MKFTCVHCKKETNDVMVMVDKKHFLHIGCKDAFNKRKEIIDKWEKSGMLDGLIYKEDIGKEFECCK